MKFFKISKLAIILSAVVFSAPSNAPAQTTNAGLTLPGKFKAEMLIDGLGGARHIAVTPNNKIYVRLSRLREGKGTVLLGEKDNKATVISRFGDFAGTGVYLKNGYLYTSSNSEVFRYKLNENFEVVDPAAPEKLVTGLVDQGTHETKSIVVDDAGNMYIPIGAPSNSCQEKDRQQGSLGIQDCPLLQSSGGVWLFKSDKLNQTYQDGTRYATGLRNVVAVDYNKQTNALYVMQHGRDQLNTIFPDLYSVKDNAELPAECMYSLAQGADAGWPFIYYDPMKKKKMLAPEYGGDGKKEGSSQYLDPVAAYPAHMAPNGLLFYTGNQFPERYKNGAFIAFHGSWNRAPEPQKGFFVVFQPFKDGKPSGDWEVFADGFAGSPEKAAIGRAERKPCGLAQGPDGSLYISDDVKGAIFKISYNANAVESAMAASLKTPAVVKAGSSGVKPVPAKSRVVKPVPAAAKKPVVASKSTAVSKSITAGKAIYMQSCVACHQVDGGGVQNLNPPLIKTSYVLGSPQRLINVLLKGMSQQPVDGERYSNAMPPYNYLSDKQIADVLTYVRNNFGNKASAITPEQVKSVRAKK
ncbi:c-type cytochrome [Desertivirga arenae]|uniref:c-type cytochrome n=1 Tax=Desertivirga arenae TaxID=2810309 RepID=UPI001F622C64|nr:c-type cytochrome [Pedobacter sp. SYSU D00823]